MRIRELLGWEDGMSGEGMEALCPSPCVLFISLSGSSFVSFIINYHCKYSDFLVCWVILAKFGTWWCGVGGHGKPWNCSQLGRSLDRLGTPFAAGIWSGGNFLGLSAQPGVSTLALGSVRIEENCRTLNWCQIIGELLLGKSKRNYQRFLSVILKGPRGYMEETAIRCGNLSIHKNNDHKSAELLVHNCCRKKILTIGGC